MSNAEKVFISHTKTDKEFARHLAEDIKALGFSVWFDEWELRIGDSLIQRIEEGIEESQWMIVILSPRSIKSEWVLKELRSGLTKEIGAKKIFVLPVLCKKVSLPSFLRDKFYADFTKSYEPGFKLIKDRLLRGYELSTSDHWLQIRKPMQDPYFQRHYYIPSINKFGGLGKMVISKNTIEMINKINNNNSEILLPISEMWFGKTGRLLLRINGNMVMGDYDWHGLSLAGMIFGNQEEGVITFSWDWKYSSEKGRGIFWTDIPNILYGGWWMDYDDVDEAAVRLKLVEIPNKWEFTNVQGLQITADLG
jgi:hypothetical protein